MRGRKGREAREEARKGEKGEGKTDERKRVMNETFH